jgi:hypothetical protein
MMRGQDTVPVLSLPAASVKSADTFGAIVGLRELAGGGLLVDDGRWRQVKLLDPSMAPGTIVLDSTTGATNYYGPNAVPLLPYVGDSTLFPSRQTATVSVIDPHGTVKRSLAMPKPADVLLLNRGGIDSAGHLIFLGHPVITRRPTPDGIPPAVSDSTPLLRADLDRRRTDTIGYVGRPMARFEALRLNGIVASAWQPDPLRVTDDWAVLADGSIAIVRGHDYHIDWIRPNGATASSPKMPFDWRQLTDSDKQHVIDAAHAAMVAAAKSNTLVLNVEMVINWRLGSAVEFRGASGGGATQPPPVLASVASPPPPGVERIRTDVDTTGGLFTTGCCGPVLILPAEHPSVSAVFDYYPPVRSGSLMPDLDDHLWILPTTSKQSKAGELVYDVVNTKGELFERVRVPLGRFVIGFGQGGVVYLASGSMTNGFVVERTKLPASAAGPSR